MCVEYIYKSIRSIRKRNASTILRLAALTIVSAVMLLVYLDGGNILFSGVWYDYLVFQTIGNAWAEGYVPYERLFDHKGPALFLIQVIAGFIAPGKFGIWILELIWCVATFELIYRCGKILSKYSWLNYFSIFVAMVFFAKNETHGNSVEMWSLPFVLFPLYQVVKAIKYNRYSNFWLSGISGLCFGIVSMIRINNNCILVGLVLGWIIYLYRHRKLNELPYSALYFIAGLLIAILPFVLYFYHHDALDEMIYATFIFNWHYKFLCVPSEVVGQCAIFNARSMWFCLVLPVVSFIYDKRNNSEFFYIISFSSLITFVTFLRGYTYSHYYLMALPILAICVQQVSCLGRKSSMAATIFLCLLYVRPAIVNGYYKVMSYYQRRDVVFKDIPPKGADVIEKYIPENQRDSVYTIGDFAISGALHYYGNLPCGKYFFFQDGHSAIDDYVKKDMVRNFHDSNPLWILKDDCDVPFIDLSRYQEVPLDSASTVYGEWKLFKRFQ